MSDIIDKVSHIKETFNTSIGKVTVVENDRRFNVGDNIRCDGGNSYTVKGIKMAASPSKQDIISLIIE